MIMERLAGVRDLDTLKRLWKDTFTDDSAEDIAAFIAMAFEDGYVLVADDNGEIVSMLFLLPQLLVFPAGVRSVGYIYAGATAAHRRGEGLYRRLLRFAARCGKKEQLSGLFLRPADEALAKSYRRMGFTVDMTCDSFSTTACADGWQLLTPSEYTAARRRALLADGVSFIDWSDTTVAYAMRWCRAVRRGNRIALVGDANGQPFAWEWIGYGSNAAPTSCGRTVGERETVGLMQWLTDEEPAPTNVYMGYGLE